jgi:hypothetical protein
MLVYKPVQAANGCIVNSEFQHTGQEELESRWSDSIMGPFASKACMKGFYSSRVFSKL